MDDKILEKFFNKQCNAEEVKTVLRWFEQETLSAEDEARWLSHWQSLGRQAAPTPADRPPLRKANGKQPYTTRRRSVFPYSIAAMVTLLLVAATVVSFLIHRFSRQEAVAQEEEQVLLKENPAGMKKSFFLFDSSKVYLNSESRLTYREGSRHRELDLRGEAYFKVKKNPDKPFIVKTGELTTTALGTEFNISSFPDENTIAVSLTEGKVQIDYKDNPENRLILLPGEQVVLDKTSGSLLMRTFDPEEITAWKHNKILFKNAGLQEIVKTLERWYGVEIKIANGNSNQANHWNYSGEFNNESLRNVLEGISYVKNFTFKMEEKYVEIYLNQTGG